MLSCSLGLRQSKLDPDLRAFFKDAQPWSFILFGQACVSREQVRALCAELRDAVGRQAIIYIDQEGGRVARLKAPEWPVWPPAGSYGEIFARDVQAGLEAAELGFRLIAHELKSIGVDGDFAPVLDVPAPDSDKIVGDRAFSSDADAVAMLARAALNGLHAGAVTGCIKHMPGHGRATADSHVALPRVSASAAELETDIAPFVALNDVEAAMTAHIVFDAWDSARPATCSPLLIDSIIRGKIGFAGLLMSDDLDMHALAPIGDLRLRAEAALGAGCDVALQCSGRLKEMAQAAEGCRTLAGGALERARAVERLAHRPAEEFDPAEGWARFKALTSALS